MRKSNYRYRNFVLIWILVLASSCGKLNQVEIKGVENIKFKGFKNNSIQLELVLEINNPSNYKITLKDVDLKITVDGKYLGHLMNDKREKIPPNFFGYKSINFNFKSINILSGASVLRKISEGRQKFIIQAEGYIKASALWGSKKIIINEIIAL